MERLKNLTTTKVAYNGDAQLMQKLNEAIDKINELEKRADKLEDLIRVYKLFGAFPPDV